MDAASRRPTEIESSVSGYMARRGNMPKLKSNRGAAKRFRRTGKGGFKRGQSHLRHILTKKTSKRKRQLGRTLQVADADVKAVRKMLPFS